MYQITGDTSLDGIADRTEARSGMKVSALYEVPEGGRAIAVG